MRKPVQYFFEVSGDSETAYDSNDLVSVSVSSVLHCLCDDGTVWYLKDNKKWVLWELPEIPQGEIK